MRPQNPEKNTKDDVFFPFMYEVFNHPQVVENGIFSISTIIASRTFSSPQIQLSTLQIPIFQPTDLCEIFGRDTYISIMKWDPIFWGGIKLKQRKYF